mgnify:CR=1 FL=1|tara:strand:- start:785 stop:1039 length:255 start_codon:yes stop_codon:yes gene_type:complete
MSTKHLSAALGVIGVFAGLYAWAEALNEMGVVNSRDIESVLLREKSHEMDHAVFRSEYREDQQRIEEKLDRVLELVYSQMIPAE